MKFYVGRSCECFARSQFQSLVVLLCVRERAATHDSTITLEIGAHTLVAAYQLARHESGAVLRPRAFRRGDATRGTRAVSADCSQFDEQKSARARRLARSLVCGADGGSGGHSGGGQQHHDSGRWGAKRARFLRGAKHERRGRRAHERASEPTSVRVRQLTCRLHLERIVYPPTRQQITS